MTTYYINEQGHSRLYDASEVAVAAEDAQKTGWTIGDAFVLVTQVGYAFSGSCNKVTAATSLKLQFAKNGGAFGDVGSATEINYVTSTTLVNDAASSNYSLTKPTNCAGSWEAGVECEDAACSTDIGTSTNYTDVAWGLGTANATAGSTYTFQVYSVTNSAVLTGTISASIVMASATVQYVYITHQ